MTSPQPARTERERVVRRRRIVVLASAVVVLTLGVVVVPRVVTSAGALPTTQAAGELVMARAQLPAMADAVTAALAVDSDLVTDEAAAALSDARDRATGASDAALPVAAGELSTAVTDFATRTAAAAMTVLGEDSDAEKSTEDALYAQIQTLKTADAAALPAAVDAVTTAAAAVRASAQAYRDEISAAAAGTSGQPTGGSVDAQLGYLLPRATDYNLEEWGNYNEAGGDCVNFTSQGLLARGWQMDGTWYSGGPWKGSKAWVSTTAMDAYLAAQGFRVNTLDDLDRVRPGDVGVFDWGDSGEGLDHTMTVSRVVYTPDGPEISFVSHNTDGQYRPLPATLTEPGSGSTMRIYSIP